MARIALAAQLITLAGLNPAYSAANVDGHGIANDGNVALHVKNASGAPVTVTCQTPTKVGGLDVAEVAGGRDGRRRAANRPLRSGALQPGWRPGLRRLQRGDLGDRRGVTDLAPCASRC